jgi:hypothetical protein
MGHSMSLVTFTFEVWMATTFRVLPNHSETTHEVTYYFN